MRIFLLGIQKDIPEEELSQRKRDLKKIRQYLIRQTSSDDKNSKERVNLMKMTFNEFLFEVGMVNEDKTFDQCSAEDIKQARKSVWMLCP